MPDDRAGDPTPARGFSQGRRRRAQAIWNHVKSLALVLAIFAVLIALTMALRFAIWLPLSHL